MRDLVVNAPSRLDALTQQIVDLTARISPAEQRMTELHNEFDATALTSVATNVATAPAARNALVIITPARRSATN